MKVETQLLALAAISVRYFLATCWLGVRMPWRAERTLLLIREFAEDGGGGGTGEGEQGGDGDGDCEAMSWGLGMTRARGLRVAMDINA
jgi:hypothetical protein